MSLFACSKKDDNQQIKLKNLQTKWNWAGKKWQEAELVVLDEGEQHYLKYCSNCHSSNGMGDIGKRSPILIRNPLVNEAADIPIKITLFGRRKMPEYSDKLSNKDIASILSYIRNAWGNRSGVIISEKQVQKYRHFNIVKLQKKWNSEDKNWQEKELRLLEFGENNYLVNCAGCHLKNGTGQTQIGAPALKGNSLVKGDPEHQINIILFGIKVMPSYAHILSDEVIASIITYEKNAWGAISGNIVSPDLVKNIRLKGQPKNQIR